MVDALVSCRPKHRVHILGISSAQIGCFMLNLPIDVYHIFILVELLNPRVDRVGPVHWVRASIYLDVLLLGVYTAL